MSPVRGIKETNMGNRIGIAHDNTNRTKKTGIYHPYRVCLCLYAKQSHVDSLNLIPASPQTHLGCWEQPCITWVIPSQFHLRHILHILYQLASGVIKHG